MDICQLTAFNNRDHLCRIIIFRIQRLSMRRNLHITAVEPIIIIEQQSLKQNRVRLIFFVTTVTHILDKP